MKFNVRMLAFEDPNPDGTPKVRVVTVPDHELTGKPEHDLERIWYYGQNDFQPDPHHCSVSMADVAEYDGKLYVAASMGWKEIDAIQYLEFLHLDRRNRQFHPLLR